MTARDFQGYRRPDGRFGTRNHLLVLSLTGLTAAPARRAAAALEGAVAIAPPYGSGLVGDDLALRDLLMTGFATHPNVGGVVLLGGKPPEVEEFAESINATGKPVAALSLDDSDHDSITLTAAAIRSGARLIHRMSRERRVPCPLSGLSIAIECGRSDPSSGLVSNPLNGRMADIMHDEGGIAMIGETVEWFGAEDLLAPRADAETAAAIRAAVRRRIEAFEKNGMDLLGNNPGATNIAAGLSTLEEKALGAIAKTGTRPIASLLRQGQAPEGPGIHLVDQPWYSPESVSNMVAAGANLVLFSTGPGNAYVSLLSPTVKITGNPDTAARLTEQIDFDADAVFTGERSFEDAAGDYLDFVLDVASGSLTFGEILGEGEEVQSRLGESL